MSTLFTRRPLGLALLPLLLCASLEAQQCEDECVYEESGGLLVVEIESATPAPGWVFEQTISGYTGTGYFRWSGPNHYSDPGHGVFGYCIWINEPGHYDLSLRNHHDHPDSTEENDVWIRMDDDPWIKTFSPTAGHWTWTTRHELSHDDKPPASYVLSAGLHRIEFSGRSTNFRMTRFHLSRPSHSDAWDTSQPESSCLDADGNFCVSRPNSTGQASTIHSSGSKSASNNDLELIARDVPPLQAGLFFFGERQISLPFGDGVLCVGAGTTGLERLPLTVSGGGGRLRHTVDMRSLPALGLLNPGSTWNFQAWFRDTLAGGGHFNLSDGLTLTITP